MRHKSIFIILILALIVFATYYWLEYRKLEQVDANVRVWQKEASNYIAFDYAGISTRLGTNTIALNQVQITYPVLMSIDKLVLNPRMEQEQLLGLQMSAEGVNFTWPGLSGALPWHGSVQVDYQYQPELKEVLLRLMLDFPQQIRGNGKLTLSKINPNVDLVFNYPDILLNNMQFKLQNKGIIQSIATGVAGDQLLINWMNTLATPEQRQSLALFWSNNALLTVDFQPDKPVPVFRIARNERLLWQHPAIIVKAE